MAPRVLVVEDDDWSLQLVVYLLKAANYDVVSARNGAEGLEVARQERPDLILMDLQMPRMDGYEAARRLKEDKDLRAVPLVAVTALAMVGDRDRVLQAGFDGYVTKPIDPEAFGPQIRRFLEPDWQPGWPPQPTAPAAPRRVTESPPFPTPGDAGTSGWASALIVDNQADNLALLRGLLQSLGLEVRSAHDAREALAQARERPPDLILSDLHMPGGDGFELLRAAKADPRLTRIPFVVLSSSVWAEEDRARSLALGASLFLTRPLEAAEILAQVQALMAGERE